MPHPSARNGQAHAEEDKAWDLKDDFKYAPKQPAGDAWKILLDPLIEKEKHRCDAWNNEIQNLLIFAGLFSGLVTAFISQSYKTLQPDPNADIVSLLAVIAEGLNNSSDVSARVASIGNQPSSSFEPSNAAVRVNICWFISLIVSLTVVLWGIIVSQWLREHQTFADQSSRDKIAIMNMRIEALEKWHVHEIITTFPIFLAIALVLFFVGMIDFLHILGNKTVLVFVAVVITITLVLLSCVTFLPALQCILLYVWILPQTPPSPCPYKSPQSGLIHAIVYYISGFLARRSRRSCALGGWLRSLSKLNTGDQHALFYLAKTWSKKTWTEIDLCWLSVRQACVCSETFDGYHKFLSYNEFPPLYDILKTFRDVGDIAANLRAAPDILAATYHCFHELSSPFTPSNNSQRKGIVERTELDSTFKLIVRRNQFLQSLLRPNSNAAETHHNLTSNINFGEVKLRMEFHSYISILHHQNMFIITDQLSNDYHAKEFYQHRVELGLRLANIFYFGWYRIEHSLQEPFPPYLRGQIFDQHRFRILGNGISVSIFQQYGHVLKTFFKSAADPHYVLTPNCLLSHRDTAEFLEKAAWDTFRIMTTLSLEKYSEEDRAKAIKIFQNIMKQISSSLSSPPPTLYRQPKNPIYLFYLIAIYVRRLNALRKQPGLCMDEAAVSELETTMSIMLVYKTNILDIAEAGDTADNAQLSRGNLHGKDRFGSVPRFSERWWSFLRGKHDTNIKDSEASPFTRIMWERRRPTSEAPPTTPAVTHSRQPWFQITGDIPRSPGMRPSMSTPTQGMPPLYTENDETGPRTPRATSSMTVSSNALPSIDAVHSRPDPSDSSEENIVYDPESRFSASPVQQTSASRIGLLQTIDSIMNPGSHAPQRSLVSSLTSLQEDNIEMVETVSPSAETLDPVLGTTIRTETPVSHVQHLDAIYNPGSLSDNPYHNGDHPAN